MRQRFHLIGLALLCSSSLAQAQDASEYGQFAPPDAFADDPNFAYYGSENAWNRRMFSAEEAAVDSKRIGQRLLLELLEGNPARAAQMCNEQLADKPDDLEALFVLACAECRTGNIDGAYDAARRAAEKGLPVERFLAGPTELLEPLLQDPRFKQMAGETQARLVHGPMLGHVTDRSASFWVRTAAEADIEVRVFGLEEGSQPVREEYGRTRADVDRTAVVEIAALEPDTQYFYEVLVDGRPANDGPRIPFRTQPSMRAKASFRVAFGGCAGYTPKFERIWDTIAERDVRAMLLLGDNIYIDLPAEPGAFHRYSYYCRQSRPEFRRLTDSTPIYAIWDDHDLAIDDIWMGPYLDRPAWKQPMLELFRENWVNPAYGAESAPGCWFSFSIGHADFFMLDCRNYRTNPFRPERTMLGPVQKAWLLDALGKSQATFKFIVSSVAWSPRAKPGSHDTWDGFPKEREEIFQAVEKNRIGGVVLLASDRHRSEAWSIDRPAGYPLYEFLSGRLTNIHTHDCVPGALFCYNEKCSFGLLTFDEQAGDPRVRYEIVSIDGEIVNSLTVRRSELEFPAGRGLR
jgi:alkaline phosphatase D